MSEFIDCEYCVMVGGVCDGQVIPVARGINYVEFMTKGSLVRYWRASPLEWDANGHIIFKERE